MATSRSRSGSGSSRTRSGATWHERGRRTQFWLGFVGTSGRTRYAVDSGEAALRLARARRAARTRGRPPSRRARQVELPRHRAEEAAAAGWLRAAPHDGRDAAQTGDRPPPRPPFLAQRPATAISRTGPSGFRSRLL